MKRFLLVALLAAVLLPVALVSTVSCGNSSSGQKDTLVINTTEFGQDVQGRNGPTPVEITVVKGVKP